MWKVVSLLSFIWFVAFGAMVSLGTGGEWSIPGVSTSVFREMLGITWFLVLGAIVLLLIWKVSKDDEEKESLDARIAEVVQHVNIHEIFAEYIASIMEIVKQHFGVAITIEFKDDKLIMRGLESSSGEKKEVVIPLREMNKRKRHWATLDI